MKRLHLPEHQSLTKTGHLPHSLAFNLRFPQGGPLNTTLCWRWACILTLKGHMECHLGLAKLPDKISWLTQSLGLSLHFLNLTLFPMHSAYILNQMSTSSEIRGSSVNQPHFSSFGHTACSLSLSAEHFRVSSPFSTFNCSLPGQNL